MNSWFVWVCVASFIYAFFMHLVRMAVLESQELEAKKGKKGKKN